MLLYVSERPSERRVPGRCDEQAVGRENSDGEARTRARRVQEKFTFSFHSHVTRFYLGQDICCVIATHWGRGAQGLGAINGLWQPLLAPELECPSRKSAPRGLALTGRKLEISRFFFRFLIFSSDFSLSVRFLMFHMIGGS